MPNYRRAFAPGASWFFTVNLLQRRRNDLLLRHVEPGKPGKADQLCNPVRRINSVGWISEA